MARWRATRRAAAAALLLIAPLLARAGSPDEARLAAQVSAARTALAQHAPVLLVAAGMDDSSNAFAGDVSLAQARLAALNPRIASLQLANRGAPPGWPRATPHTLPEALAEAGRLLRHAPGHPVAVVLLSTHGNRNHLLLHAPGMRDDRLVSGAQLRRWLQPLEGTPTLVVLSACHAGSLIPALRRPERIVMAAARADRASFGCDTESHDTFFADELFHALAPGLSFDAWFAATRRAVATRERRLGLAPPSLPQWQVGSRLRSAAARPVADWLHGAH